tara:strand:- start:144 stop:560 length:417 start_codon:yes stop_codon:yes gene_type:complete
MGYISSTASQADASDGIEDGVIDISFYRNHVIYIKLDKKMIGLTTDINELSIGETYCIVLQQNEKGKKKVLFDADYAENLWGKLSKKPQAQSKPFTFTNVPQISLEPNSISMISCLCISGINGKQLLCSVASGFPGKE